MDDFLLGRYFGAKRVGGFEDRSLMTWHILARPIMHRVRSLRILALPDEREEKGFGRFWSAPSWFPISPDSGSRSILVRNRYSKHSDH